MIEISYLEFLIEYAMKLNLM